MQGQAPEPLAVAQGLQDHRKTQSAEDDQHRDGQQHQRIPRECGQACVIPEKIKPGIAESAD